MVKNDEKELAMTGARAARADVASTEDEIATAIHAGDHRRAVTLCAERYAEPVGRLCMALVGSQAEAEDLTQETLMAAHDGFQSWRGEGTVRAWIFGIARRRCARHLEKHARRQSRLRLVYDAKKSEDTEEVVLRRQRAARARAALERIRPSEREALLLRYGSDLTFKEVAAACGIDEAAARKRASRAIGRLRKSLANKE